MTRPEGIWRRDPLDVPLDCSAVVAPVALRTRESRGTGVKFRTHESSLESWVSILQSGFSKLRDLDTRPQNVF